MKRFAKITLGRVARVAATQAGAQLLRPLPGTRLQAQPLAKPTQDPAPVVVQVSGTPTTAVVSWAAPTQTLMLTLTQASLLPPPRDPAGVSATVAADASVIVVWQEVPGVLSDPITGVVLPAPGWVSRATAWRSAKLAPGPRQWRVASVYEPGGVLTAASARPAVMSHTPPKPGMPFLTLPAGLGTTTEIQDHHQKQCPPEAAVYTNDLHLICAGKSASELLSWSIGGGVVGKAGPGRTWPGAAFADTLDLGVGRRVSCWKSANSESRLCWATNHGEVPGSGAVVCGAGRARAATTTSDSQGTKAVPQACINCHGGRYDPTTRAVVGASLLPLVPAHLAFASPQTRASSEEDIRRINPFVLKPNPAPMIAAQITTLHNGAPFTPGARANDNAVPPGWAQRPGLYRQGTAPYCGSCHCAQTGSLGFASFGNSVQQRAAIQRTVCAEFTGAALGARLPQVLDRRRHGLAAGPAVNRARLRQLSAVTRRNRAGR